MAPRHGSRLRSTPARTEAAFGPAAETISEACGCHGERGAAGPESSTDPLAAARLIHTDRREVAVGERALEGARKALEHGRIVAVRSGHGVELLCRADHPAAVQSLRARSGRAATPLLLLLRDEAVAAGLFDRTTPVPCTCGDDARTLQLTPGASPSGAGVAPAIAPLGDDLAWGLAAPGWEAELFRGATFGALAWIQPWNVAADPPDGDPDGWLGELTDLVLECPRSDRDLACLPMLRAGFPGAGPSIRPVFGSTEPLLELPCPLDEPLIALGGARVQSVCFASGRHAWLAVRRGGRPTVDRLRRAIERLESAHGATAARFVVDAELPPATLDLLGRRSGSRPARVERVQHHLAHAAAVLAEHGRFPRSVPARGVREQAAVWILGDAGAGTDGDAWGCELLTIDAELGWSRVASAEPVAVVGGTAEEPWRRLATVLSAYDWVFQGTADLPVHADDLRLFRQLALRAPRRCRTLTGCFDALAALLGLVVRGQPGGESSLLLESLAAGFAQPEGRGMVRRWRSGAPEVHPRLLSFSRLIEDAAGRVQGGETPSRIARGFHKTLAWRIASLARAVLPARVNVLGFAGESLTNRILVGDLEDACRAFGFEPLFPHRVAPGDSGLAYGQAVLLSVALARGVTLREQPGSDTCRWPC